MGGATGVKADGGTVDDHQVMNRSYRPIARFPFARRLVGCVVAAVLASACGTTTFDDSTRNDAGEVIEAGDVGVLAIKVGDCFDDPPGLLDSVEQTEIEAVAAIPCSEPHDNQAYAKFDLADGDWPGQQVIADDAFDGCLDRFESMIGEPYETSPLDIMPLSPTEEGWRFGDQEVLCAVYNVDLSKLTTDVISPGA
ncbi:MAG: septum formation family protein [Actinomycetota bacterium]